MADCYALEADDLHRRWLPREIFADLGIVDTEPAAVVAAAAKPEADAATVEELAVQLASILGATAATGGKGKADPPAPPPAAPVATAPPPAAPVAAAPPPPPPAAAAPRKKVRLAVVKSKGGGNGAGAAVAWVPVPPYSVLPLQWQVPTNYVYAGGALTYALLPPPPPPCIVPPPPGAKLHGGTGVFLPRAALYRHAHPPAKDVKAPTVKGPSPRAWPGTVKAVLSPQKEEVPAAAGRPSQQRQRVMPQPQVQQKAAATAAPVQVCSEAAAALPQDWSYH